LVSVGSVQTSAFSPGCEPAISMLLRAPSASYQARFANCVATVALSFTRTRSGCPGAGMRVSAGVLVMPMLRWRA
jgi:hypothetical protein